jgi:hypothetical protein
VGTAVLLGADAIGVLFRVDDQVPPAGVERQVAVATVLERADIPAIRLVGDHPQPVVFDDPALAVTVWQMEELTGAVVGPGELGDLARRLHDISDVDAQRGGVPPFEPTVAITEQLATAVTAGATSPADLDLLVGLNARLAEQWLHEVDSPGTRRGLVHGDLHAENVLATRRGPVLADLEQSGIGPVAFDLVAVVVAVERYGAPGSTIDDFVAGYGVPIPPEAHGGVLRDTYELWLTAWAVANRHLDDAHEHEAQARLHRWRKPSGDGSAVSGDVPAWTLL